MNQMYRRAKGAMIDLTEMARLWNYEGLSASEIAARIGGISRAAVLGYVHRNKDLFESRAKKGLYKRTGGVKPEKRDPSMPRPASSSGGHTGLNIYNIHKARMEATRREAEQFAAGTSEYLKIAPTDAERLNAGMGKEMMGLGVHECRFGLNNGSPFIFCSAATDDGAVYCSHHAKRAYRLRESWER